LISVEDIQYLYDVTNDQKDSFAAIKAVDPPHLMIYLSGEPPGFSSVDAIPIWGNPRILLT